MRVILTALLALNSLQSVSTSPSVKIENALVAPPKLECFSDSILVRIRTQQPFFGRLFVKGQSHLSECSAHGQWRDGALSVQNSLQIYFDDCFLRRQRVFSPRRGVVVTTTVVVSFHPHFLTESDAVYRLQCIYLDGKQSLSAILNVHDAQSASPQISPSLLPTCKYEILDGGPDGQPVPLASVGSRVYHKWQCHAPTPNKYCALIHSCIAEDGNGVNVQILDEQGCTKDSVLLHNLEYVDDLTAGQTAVVYKFADRESIFFKCEIMVTQKQEHKQCPRPVCAPSTGLAMTHFKSAPPNSSVSVVFDRRVLALRRRIRDTMSMDVLTELNVLETPFQEPLASVTTRPEARGLLFALLVWFFVFHSRY